MERSFPQEAAAITLAPLLLWVPRRRGLGLSVIIMSLMCQMPGDSECNPDPEFGQHKSGVPAQEECCKCDMHCASKNDLCQPNSSLGLHPQCKCCLVQYNQCTQEDSFTYTLPTMKPMVFSVFFVCVCAVRDELIQTLEKCGYTYQEFLLSPTCVSNGTVKNESNYESSRFVIYLFIQLIDFYTTLPKKKFPGQVTKQKEKRQHK